ncbi:MAG: hypothetical protein JWR50_1358 [Mucilaginibacter sp.]|nr:hypothetical protein [Mucilaginibacter sp.]
METQNFKNNNNGQGSTTADRAFNDQSEKLKERGISNAGGQRSFQTSSKDSAHKPERRKPQL